MIAHADTIPPARHPLIAWILRWILTTNHKKIGTLYLCLSFAMFIVGGAMAMVFRLELAQPGLQFVGADFYNQMVTLHSQVRKAIPNKGHFPSDEAATKLIYLALRNITAKWNNPPRE